MIIGCYFRQLFVIITILAIFGCAGTINTVCADPLNTAIIQAAGKGDLYEVELLLTKGVDAKLR